MYFPKIDSFLPNTNRLLIVKDLPIDTTKSIEYISLLNQTPLFICNDCYLVTEVVQSFYRLYLLGTPFYNYKVGLEDITDSDLDWGVSRLKEDILASNSYTEYLEKLEASSKVLRAMFYLE